MTRHAFITASRSTLGLRILLAAVALASGAAPLRAASLVPSGAAAPDFTLPTLAGDQVSLKGLAGKVVILVFGELYNANSVAACQDIATVLAKPEFASREVPAFMIVTQQGRASTLRREAGQKGVTLPILHDPDRRVFAEYRVVVLPSVIVIDEKGAAVLPCAGYPLGFQDMLFDALLYAESKRPAAGFSVRSETTSPAASDAARRAIRLAKMGAELTRRGSEELAIGHYRDAVKLDPDCALARIGLGKSLLNRGELPEAEKHFSHVLAAGESVEAALGLIQIGIIRGGAELHMAGDQLRELLRLRPADPRVAYLAGLVAEKSGAADAAIGHYRRAAELVLFGRQRRWESR